MRKQLIWLNVALAALIAVAGNGIVRQWNAAQARNAQARQSSVKPAAVKSLPIPPAPAPVTAARYGEIATKTLFSPERNPNVVVVVPAPPPPKPEPPLPVLHGVMGLPSGTIALLSAKRDSRSIGVHVGEKIGEWELADVSRDEIAFKWEDKIEKRSVSEMIYHVPEPTAAEKTPAVTTTASASGAATQQPAPANPANTGKAGSDTGAPSGLKNCAAGDTSPAGTEADGFRKVLKPTPFGSSCYWEPIK